MPPNSSLRADGFITICTRTVSRALFRVSNLSSASSFLGVPFVRILFLGCWICWIVQADCKSPLLVLVMLGYSSTCTGLLGYALGFLDTRTPCSCYSLLFTGQPFDKSRRKKRNISLLILRRCIDRMTAYWAPPTPMHEKTPKDGNGQPPKGVGVKKTINVCPRGARAVHRLLPSIARYPLQQFD